MKLKNLVDLPEKKDEQFFTQNKGYNQAIDQIGNIEVELDVKKILDITIEWFKKKHEEDAEYFAILDDTTCVIDGSYHLKELIQIIADNFKDIVKK